ncbi:hypothetical protein H5410_043165 [Solanum commersonii]|uniref:DUF4283 domain-containing protein n=1 Tax=Solanum commersonii TaxID=4109 RepID=A0A9J5XWE9_SOLCO|nr:hypothetical protein H5410_043165 [Solanum commersonii]
MTAAGQPLREAGQQTFASLFKSPAGEVTPLPLKLISYLHGKPRSYRKKQRATLLKGYVNLLSKPVFYLTQQNWTYQMRTLKWDPLFNLEEETSTTIAWISFPSLPLKFFGKETVFSLAVAVGKPLQNSNTKEGDTGKKNFRQKELTEELETDANNDENHIKGKEGHGRVLEGEFEEDRFLEGKQYKEGPSKKKINQVWNRVRIITTNKFEALNGKEETDNLEQQHREISEGTKITTKQWVEDTFSVPSKTAHEEKDIEEAGNTTSNVEKVMNQ